MQLLYSTQIGMHICRQPCGSLCYSCTIDCRERAGRKQQYSFVAIYQTTDCDQHHTY